MPAKFGAVLYTEIRELYYILPVEVQVAERDHYLINDVKPVFFRLFDYLTYRIVYIFPSPILKPYILLFSMIYLLVIRKKINNSKVIERISFKTIDFYI